jgi:multiple antibiotic resistance protein
LISSTFDPEQRTAIMSSDLAINAFATLFVAIGPIDTAIVFGGLTGGIHRPERFRLAWQAVLVAGVVLLGFALFGNQVLPRFGSR